MKIVIPFSELETESKAMYDVTLGEILDKVEAKAELIYGIDFTLTIGMNNIVIFDNGPEDDEDPYDQDSYDKNFSD